MGKLKHIVFLSVCGLTALIVAITTSLSGVRADDGNRVRWDIVHFPTFSPPTVEAGGTASAHAEDLSKITLTGTGAFSPGDSDEVTGGGTWQTFAPDGTPTGSGTYRVSGLIKFDQVPGTLLGTPIIDHIGNAAEAHSGLAFLRIRYSDGSRGVLAVSCHLPAGTPPQLFEGITASKGYVGYWSHDEPINGVDGNRTVFHTSARED